MKTLRSNLKTEIFFEHNAALLEIETAPFLEKFSVQHFLGKLLRYLSVRIILPLVKSAAVNKLTSLSVALHRVMHGTGSPH